MKKTPQLGIAARLILACMLLLFSLSFPLTVKDGQAFATTPNTGSPLIKRQAQPAGNLIQAVGWYDNFDSYATGSSLQGQGGWKGWANSPAAAALTSDEHAFSTPNSVDIAPAADTVHEYSGYIAGKWVYNAWQYIPTDFAGESYFILLNQYDDLGNTLNWSVQVNFNSSTNLVENTGVSGGTLPLIKGAWMLLSVEFDLTHDTCSFYYGGQLLYEGTWTGEVSGSGISNLAAVDLFANGASSIYYDDLSLTPKLVPLYLPLIVR